MNEPLLTARELSERLAVSPETILRWMRRGELPAIKLPGGAVRFCPDKLDAWLESRTLASPAGTDAAEVTRTETGLASGDPTLADRRQGDYRGAC